MKKLHSLIVLMPLTISFCFAGVSDTLIIGSKNQTGNVILKDSVLGIMNYYYFTDKTSNQPITGVVKLLFNDDSNVFYTVKNGIAIMKKDVLSKSKFVISYYNEDYFLSKTFKRHEGDTTLKELYYVSEIEGELIFCHIKLKRGKLYLKQSFFNKKKKLTHQKMVIKNVNLIFKLPELLNYYYNGSTILHPQTPYFLKKE